MILTFRTFYINNKNITFQGLENKMKKLLLSTTVLMLSTSAFATDGKDNRAGVYLKLNVGANKLNTAKEKIEDINKTITSKAEISPIFSLGLGGYINEFVRTDLTFDYSKVNFDDGKATGFITHPQYDYEYDEYYQDTKSYSISLDRKTSIYSIMLNSYVDLPVTNNIKFFVGGGVGLAKIKEKVSCTLNVIGYNPIIESSTTKNNNNFAYSLTAGTSVKASTNTTLEFTYSWKDFGKTHHKKDKDGNKADKNRYRGHILTAGIRFDI